MTQSRDRGWWVEHEDDPEINPFAPEAPWRATLQLDSGCFSLEGVAFFTEADCARFIQSEIIGRPSITEGDQTPGG